MKRPFFFVVTMCFLTICGFLRADAIKVPAAWDMIEKAKGGRIEVSGIDERFILCRAGNEVRVYDVSSRKEACSLAISDPQVKISPLCMKDGFVYFYLAGPQLSGNIFRFSLADWRLDRQVLPVNVLRIVDLRPDRVLCVFRDEGKECVLLSVDLDSGQIRRYEFPEMPPVAAEKSDFWSRIRFCGDINGGKFLFACDGRLYVVSRSGNDMPWPAAGWTSTMPETVKDILKISNGSGKSVQWCRKDTFMVAAVQAVSEMARPDVNRRRLAGLVHQAASAGAKVVVLPETAITGYMSYDLVTTWQVDKQQLSKGLEGLDPRQFAETVPGVSTRFFGELAKELNIYLTVPFLEIDSQSGQYYNTLVLAEPDGKCEKHYRKINPWPFAERGWASRGDLGNVVLDTPYGRMGLLICFDINFEPANMHKLGVDHLLYSIAWVDGRNSSWFSQKLPAIARKNNLNIIGANWTVPDSSKPAWHGYGKTLVISRDGSVIAKTDRDIGQRIILAELEIVKEK